MRIDAPIITGSFSLNGSTLGSLASVATTGSNTFLGGQSATSFAGDQLTANDRAYLRRIDGIAGTTIEVIAPISASAGITGSTNFDTIVNKPTLVSGSSQVIDILSSLNTTTASFTPRISNLESKSASVDISISNINSVTASNIARLTNLESKSASVDISITNINSYTSSQDTKNTTLGSYTGSNDTKWTSIGNVTGSYATTGSNTFFGTQTYSGSVYIANDLIVQGSSSIQYISASSVSIGTNIVQLNTATPSVRYAGLSVQDSGSSAGVTGSMLWDSLCNRWIYSNPSTIGYSGGILMSGPRAATFGTETTLTCNYIAKSGGGDHLYDSCIWEMSGSVGINCATPSYNLDVNGCGRFSGAVTAAGAIFTSATETRGNIRTTFTSDNSYYSLFSNDGALTLDTYGTGGYMNFKILGSTKLSITSTGAASFSSSVNINGASTTNDLNIYNTNNAGISLQTSYTGTTGSDGFYMGQLFQSTNFLFRQRENADIVFDTNNGSERMRITSGGMVCFACQVCTAGLYSNCAIGINSHNSAIPLQIKRWTGSSGTVILIGNDNVVGMPALSFCNDNGGGTAYVSMTSNCQININGSIYACPSGNVGILTTDPKNLLHIKSAASGLASYDSRYKVILESNGEAYYIVTTPDNSYAGFRILGTASASKSAFEYYMAEGLTHIYSNCAMRFHVGGSERMKIDTGGYVGIGICTPSAPLHIKGTSSVYSYGYPQLMLEDSNSNYPAIVFAGTSGGHGIIRIEDGNGFSFSTFANGASAQGNAFVIKENGRIGTGGISSPQALLHVPKSIMIDGDGGRRLLTVCQASGNFSSIKIDVAKSSWGSVIFDARLASASTQAILSGGVYMNGGLSALMYGVCTSVNASHMSVTEPTSQAFRITICASMTHPIVTFDVAMGAGYSLLGDDVKICFIA
jgi:hypothetical protein